MTYTEQELNDLVVYLNQQGVSLADLAHQTKGNPESAEWMNGIAAELYQVLRPGYNPTSLIKYLASLSGDSGEEIG